MRTAVYFIKKVSQSFAAAAAKEGLVIFLTICASEKYAVHAPTKPTGRDKRVCSLSEKSSGLFEKWLLDPRHKYIVLRVGPREHLLAGNGGGDIDAVGPCVGHPLL